MILTGENIDPPLLKTVSDLARNSGIIEHASNLSNKIKKNIFSADLVTFCPRQDGLSISRRWMQRMMVRLEKEI